MTVRKEIRPNKKPIYIADFRIDGKRITISYSEKCYGKYAKKLAELSNETHKRYHNVILKKKNYYILRVFNKRGCFDSKFDECDLEFIISRRWWIKYNSNSNKYPYVETKIDGKGFRLHRLLCDCTEDKVVDHRNRDTLDNRRKNLLLCDIKDNNQNKSISKNNTSGAVGVYENKWSFTAIWRDENQYKRKSFCKKEYGYNEAFRLAVQCRNENTKHYNKFKNVKIKRV